MVKINEIKLWEDNDTCPICGEPVDPRIKAAETGLNYCSLWHALKDVIAKKPEGGY